MAKRLPVLRPRHESSRVGCQVRCCTRSAYAHFSNHRYSGLATLAFAITENERHHAARPISCRYVDDEIHERGAFWISHKEIDFSVNGAFFRPIGMLHEGDQLSSRSHPHALKWIAGRKVILVHSAGPRRPIATLPTMARGGVLDAVPHPSIVHLARHI